VFVGRKIELLLSVFKKFVNIEKWMSRSFLAVGEMTLEPSFGEVVPPSLVISKRRGLRNNYDSLRSGIAGIS